MKKINKVMVLVLTLILAITTTACNGNVAKEPVYACRYDQIMLSTNAIESISDSFKEDTIINEAEENIQSQVNELSADIAKYINEEYDLNWKSDLIKIYLIDMESIGKEFYNAIFDSKTMAIYVNESFKDNENFIYIVAHELIHYLRFLNIGKCEFVELIGGEYYLGYYFMESMTDVVAIKYFESLGNENAKKCFYTNSSYCSGDSACFMLEEMIGDGIEKYYLIDDMDTLHSKFNEIAKKTINAGKKDIFYQFLYQIDNILIYIMRYAETMDSRYLSEVSHCYYATYETLALMSNLYDDKVKEEMLKDMIELFEIEGTENDEPIKDLVNFVKKSMNK